MMNMLRDIGRLTGVSCFANERHQGVFVQCSRLVVRGLEYGRAAHGGFRGRDEGKVLARYS